MQEENKEVLTEVTSIAAEEEKTGQTIETPPTPEELVAKSGMAIIMNRQHLNKVFAGLGKKAKDRVMLAILDLPTGEQPVKLISKEEKAAFRLGQNIIRAMFTVMFYHTSEEIIKKHKEKSENNNNPQDNEEKKVCLTETEVTQSSQ